jgi:hypothetical protein
LINLQPDAFLKVRNMKTITRTSLFTSPALEVFRIIDDLGVTGVHMTESSMMMMGSKLILEYLTANRTGLNSKYRWYGKMMGIPMHFTVLVTKWNPGKEKVWETIGESKLVIYSWYRMALHLEESISGTFAILSISYKRPAGFWGKLLSYIFADIYCIWCLRKMLTDANHSLAQNLSINKGRIIQEMR